MKEMSIYYTKTNDLVRNPKASHCQFTFMCKAARTVSIYTLIPDLKRKHKSQKLHFRPFGWCQLEELNSLKKEFNVLS
jgi:hypothetical protein